MIPILAQTSFPTPSPAFAWQAVLFVMMVVTAVVLWRSAFPARQPPIDVELASKMPKPEKPGDILVTVDALNTALKPITDHLANGAMLFASKTDLSALRADEEKLRAQFEQSLSQRITTLETKDARDVDSRTRMHKELDAATKAMALLDVHLQSAKQTIPTMDAIRGEIDRSIAAGEKRVQSLSEEIQAMRDAHVADVTQHGERISALESWRTDHVRNHS